MSAALLELKVCLEGKCDDGVTPKRTTKLRLSSSLNVFSRTEKQKLQSAFASSNIDYKWQDAKLMQGITEGAWLAIEDLEKAQEAVESAGLQIKETVPYFVWEKVVRKHPVFEDQTMARGVGPDVWNVLHPFQKTGVRFLAERNGGYLADEMGTGKTLQALAVSRFFRNQWPCLVACPSSLKYIFCRLFFE